jgi:hypothetical protein
LTIETVGTGILLFGAHIGVRALQETTEMVREVNGVVDRGMMELTQIMAMNTVTRTGSSIITNSNVQIHTPLIGPHATAIKMHVSWA